MLRARVLAALLLVPAAIAAGLVAQESPPPLTPPPAPSGPTPMPAVLRNYKPVTAERLEARGRRLADDPAHL